MEEKESVIVTGAMCSRSRSAYQFRFAAVTGCARGQKAKNKMGVMKHNPAMLIARPYFPRDHRRGGRGAP